MTHYEEIDSKSYAGGKGQKCFISHEWGWLLHVAETVYPN